MYDLIRAHNRSNDLFTLPNLINRLFEEGSRTQASLTPAVDILETDGAIKLVFEVPGLDKQSLSVTFENSTLSVSGEKKPQGEVPENAYFSGERRFGKFARAFTIPVRVDPNGIAAKYQDGLLEVVLPKAAEAQPRKIEVK